MKLVTPIVVFALVVMVWHINAEETLSQSRVILADAVEKQDDDAIDALLDSGSDPNVSQADGTTALHWAAYFEDVDRAKRLITAGAKINATNRYGVPVLSLACESGNTTIVALLLKHGADANAQRAGKETVLMTAARTGKIENVRALIDAGAKINAKEQRGQTALMWAADAGHADVVAVLIEAGAEYKQPLKSGFTPFAFAVRNGHADVAQLLIDAGVEIDRPMKEAKGGNNQPFKNMTPLLLAMENGHFELAKTLLEAGADPNTQGTGYSPLHAVSWIRKPETGDNQFSAPPPRGSGKLTSLDLVRELVKHGADVTLGKAKGGGPRRKISIKGTTPFLCAAATADVPYMKLLLELGADPHQTNDRGQTALMLAAGLSESGESDGPATPGEHFAAVSYLLDEIEEIDMNAVDQSGETAMHGAAYKMLPRVVHLLAKHGADIKVWSKPSKQGRTPLSIAQGFRPGNFKPSYETIEAIERVMRAAGVNPPPPPKQEDGARY
ncbi:MAG: ankyrin repeat domain-containing protein [Phycisphaeraceae bacterium]|nr:ankyrin repeat domain-containing protein [Phycisphaeraceae bacterium]